MPTYAISSQAPAAAEAPRVLVAEDEFLIRMLVADHLRDAGFTVVEASSGDEAIAILKAGAVFDLVFTDVRMPGSVDGMGLLDFVKRTQPAVPVLVTSGHLEPHLAYSRGAEHFISKPCDLDQMVVAFHDALAIAQ